MYRLLGNTVVDVEELISLFNENNVSVYRNVTNATKRDDAIGLKLFLPIEEISNLKNIDIDEIDSLMIKAEKYYKDKIDKLIDKNFRFELYSYGYDEVENAILLNFVMMDSFMQRKLKDIVKRLFDV